MHMHMHMHMQARKGASGPPDTEGWQLGMSSVDAPGVALHFAWGDASASQRARVSWAGAADGRGCHERLAESASQPASSRMAVGVCGGMW